MAKVSTWTTAIAGVSYRQDEVQYCYEGQQVSLVREPRNPHDENAIKVTAEGLHIGYIGRDEAEGLAPAMDAGDRIEASIDALLEPEADWPNIGVRIKIVLTPRNSRNKTKKDKRHY